MISVARLRRIQPTDAASHRPASQLPRQVLLASAEGTPEGCIEAERNALSCLLGRAALADAICSENQSSFQEGQHPLVHRLSLAHGQVVTRLRDQFGLNTRNQLSGTSYCSNRVEERLLLADEHKGRSAYAAQLVVCVRDRENSTCRSEMSLPQGKLIQ
jgi:hypothetical protein